MALLPIFSMFTFALGGEPIDIDSRLELFVDDHLIDETKGHIPQQIASTRKMPPSRQTSLGGNTSVY